MTKLLQVGNDIFEYPQQGTGQGHGEDATAWAEAVTAALADFLGPNDILITSQALLNGTYPATPGTGTVSELSFNLSQVQHVNVEFLIIRQYLRRVTGINSTDDVNDSTETITAINHVLTNGQIVRVITESGALPAGLAESTDYKVVYVDKDNFQLTTLADVTIDLTDAVGTFSVQEQTIDTIVESGKIYGNYNGSDFRISMESVGDDALVDIDVNGAGQFSYSATPLPDQSLGQIYFKARTIDQ